VKSLEDIMLWPDGTWCYREELEEMLTWMSDDYEVIPVDAERWIELTTEKEKK
jgi:hypothetical protein